MAEFLWDMVDYTELTNYVRAYDQEVLRPEGNIVLDGYLPNVETDELEFRVRKGGLLDVDAAQFRAWDTPAIMTGRQGLKRVGGELAPIARQIPLSEEEFLRKRAFDTQSNEPIVNQIYADAEQMVRAVQTRVELARGDLIDDATLTINEGGLVFNIDWGRSATASPTAGTLWGGGVNGTPLADMLGWLEDYTDLNGVEPAHTLISRQKFNTLALNDELRAYWAAGGTTPSRLNETRIKEALAQEGLPPFLIYDGKFRVNGTLTRVLDQTKVYMMPPPGVGLGETRYGVTAEALKLAERGFIERSAMPGVVAVVTENPHPVQMFTNAAAIALPIMPNPDLVFDCTVFA